MWLHKAEFQFYKCHANNPCVKKKESDYSGRLQNFANIRQGLS
jgi:hypothetical protein